MVKKIVRILLILLIIAAIAIYVVDIVVNQTPPMEHLVKMALVVLALSASFARTFTRNNGGVPRSLSFYEDAYAEKIKTAFDRSPKERKMLLKAIRFCANEKYPNAVKILLKLRLSCKRDDDEHAVGLFLAVCLKEMHLYEEAITQYEALIKRGIASTTVYSNLGQLYTELGEADRAVECFEKSIEADPENPYPYNNIAGLYFGEGEFEKAKEFAHKALEKNRKIYQASTLLAIIYSVENDAEKAKKYSQMAITSGQDPQKLKNAIAHYKSLNTEE